MSIICLFLYLFNSLVLFSIERYFFSTPFTPSGKARGELQEQWMRRTILTTEKTFPYVKRRLEVVHIEKTELNPLEVAILNMEGKISQLKSVLERTPCDAKLLQMQLQGGIATAVNQVIFLFPSLYPFISPLPLSCFLLSPSSIGSFCNCQMFLRRCSITRTNLSSSQT